MPRSSAAGSSVSRSPSITRSKTVAGVGGVRGVTARCRPPRRPGRSLSAAPSAPEEQPRSRIRRAEAGTSACSSGRGFSYAHARRRRSSGSLAGTRRLSRRRARDRPPARGRARRAAGAPAHRRPRQGVAPRSGAPPRSHRGDRAELRRRADAWRRRRIDVVLASGHEQLPDVRCPRVAVVHEAGWFSPELRARLEPGFLAHIESRTAQAVAARRRGADAVGASARRHPRRLRGRPRTACTPSPTASTATFSPAAGGGAELVAAAAGDDATRRTCCTRPRCIRARTSAALREAMATLIGEGTAASAGRGRLPGARSCRLLGAAARRARAPGPQPPATTA